MSTPTKPAKDWFAILSLVLALASTPLLCCIVGYPGSIIAVILGGISIARTWPTVNNNTYLAGAGVLIAVSTMGLHIFLAAIGALSDSTYSPPPTGDGYSSSGSGGGSSSSAWTAVEDEDGQKSYQLGEPRESTRSGSSSGSGSGSKKSGALGVTKAGFDAIETGMTYKEVVTILGEDGELVNSVDMGIPGLETQMYMWRPGLLGGSPGSSMNVTFQGGGVTAKAQMGLR